MLKFFRILITLLIVAVVGTAVAAFFIAERQERQIENTLQAADAGYLAWAEQNKCLVNPKPCTPYSKTILNWKIQIAEYKSAKEKSPNHQIFATFKSFDEKYLAFAYLSGRASLAVFSVFGLLIALAVFVLLSGKKNSTKSKLLVSPKISKSSTSSVSIVPPSQSTVSTKEQIPPPLTNTASSNQKLSDKDDIIKGLDALLEEDEPIVLPTPTEPPPPAPALQPKTAPTIELEPAPASISEPNAPATVEPKDEPPSQADEELSLALETLNETEPNFRVAIDHLENALAGDIEGDLRVQALLLCGTLRVKNKINELKGVEYLSKFLEVAPEGSSAEKAKKLLSLELE
ncbi:hypothetical protein AGMMS49938_10950 [Fibrobacterales bacterium]|nr:hypothetical protein AGMMS49938_10950 [Fibrobacterales bacterium]